MGERPTNADSKDARFEQFVTPYFAALFRRACRLTGDVTEAEDLVQELCVRAYDAVDELAGMNNPTGWLFAVLYHLFIDSRRSERSSHLYSIDGLGSDAMLELVSGDPGPAEQAETGLLHRRLRQALRALSPIEQVLLVLREVEGYSLTEISVIVELPVSTVRPRLHRAREKLGRLMQLEDLNTTRGADHELRRRQSSAG